MTEHNIVTVTAGAGQWDLFFAVITTNAWIPPLVIASGLSVGKEGPSVHVACCIGNLIASLFKGFSRSQGGQTFTRLSIAFDLKCF